MALVRRSSGAVARRNQPSGVGGALARAIYHTVVGETPENTLGNLVRKEFWKAVQNPAKRLKGVDIDFAGNVITAPVKRGKTSNAKAIEYKRKRPITFPMVTRSNVGRRRYLRAKRYTRKGRAKRKRGVYPTKWKRKRRSRKPRTARAKAHRGYACARRCWGILAPGRKTLESVHFAGYVPTIHKTGTAFHSFVQLTNVASGDAPDQSRAKYLRMAGVSVKVRIAPSVQSVTYTNYTEIDKMDQWFKIIIVRQKTRNLRGGFLNQGGGGTPLDGLPLHLTEDLYEVRAGTETEPALWHKKTYNNGSNDETDIRFHRYFQVVYEKTFHLCDSAGPLDSTAVPSGVLRRMDDLKSLKREVNQSIYIPYRKLVQHDGATAGDQHNGLFMLVATCNQTDNAAAPTAGNDGGLFLYSYDYKINWYDSGDQHY